MDDKIVAALLTNALYSAWLVQIQEHGEHMDVSKLHHLRELVINEYKVMQDMIKH